LMAEGRAIPFCPEEEGGLGTPRPPAEIVGGDGDDVLRGRARVVTVNGRDVTQGFLQGAYRALAAARGAEIAVLKARSPSCGKGRIHDGSFSGSLVAGDGVTAALFQNHGITVLTEEEIG
jgi:uncharacterized protein YbbK (DUF523 family)